MYLHLPATFSCCSWPPGPLKRKALRYFKTSRGTNPVTCCHVNAQSTATTLTCTASSSNCITSQTFSLSRAFSPCSSTSSHSLISFARLWYTLFVAETSVELENIHKVKWQVQILHWQHILTYSCSPVFIEDVWFEHSMDCRHSLQNYCAITR